TADNRRDASRATGALILFVRIEDEDRRFGADTSSVADDVTVQHQVANDKQSAAPELRYKL
ncbi:MAG: hypothetical protein AB7O38_27925, partial [Pirellulaceae bacterium]